MSKPAAVHYQAPHYPKGHFACNVNWVGLTDNRWTDDPTKVQCGNCERTTIFQEAYTDRLLIEHMMDSADKAAIRRHISGAPMRHPHILESKAWIGLNRVNGRFDFTRTIIVMGHGVRS